MEKKQLDFNAPLLSVRRFSSPSHASNLTKRKPIEELSKPASVPFHWEQIPGRPKNGVESQIHTPSNTPRLPPGRVSGPTTYNSGDQNGAHTEAFSLNDHAEILDKLKESLNCRDKSDTESQDYDGDPTDRISQADSSSLNYRVSVLSGYENPGSIDTKTKDFMMNRFLPAAKAAVLETPKYVVKKPKMVFDEKSKPVKRVVLEDKNPLLDDYNEYINDDVESEDEEDMELPVHVRKSGKLSWRIIPQFCAKNSLCLSPPLEKNASRHKKNVPEIKNKSRVSQLRRYRSGSISPYRPTIDIQCEKTDQTNETNESKQNQNLGRFPSLESGQNLESTDDEKEYHRAVIKSPLPPPLPKSPSESWLWRTLPSIPLGNALSQSRVRKILPEIPNRKILPGESKDL